MYGKMLRQRWQQPGRYASPRPNCPTPTPNPTPRRLVTPAPPDPRREALPVRMAMVEVERALEHVATAEEAAAAAGAEPEDAVVEAAEQQGLYAYRLAVVSAVLCCAVLCAQQAVLLAAEAWRAGSYRGRSAAQHGTAQPPLCEKVEREDPNCLPLLAHPACLRRRTRQRASCSAATVA